MKRFIALTIHRRVSCIVMKFLRLLRFLVYGYFCCSTFFHLGLVHGLEEDSSSHILTRSPRHSSSSSSSNNSNYSNYSLFKLEITHRFSDKARIELKEKRYHGVGDHLHLGCSSWPIVGSAEYHNMLWIRDWRRHRGRLLMSASKHSLLTYSAGNLTEEWSDG